MGDAASRAKVRTSREANSPGAPITCVIGFERITHLAQVRLAVPVDIPPPTGRRWVVQAAVMTSMPNPPSARSVASHIFATEAHEAIHSGRPSPQPAPLSTSDKDARVHIPQWGPAGFDSAHAVHRWPHSSAIHAGEVQPSAVEDVLDTRSNASPPPARFAATQIRALSL